MRLHPPSVHRAGGGGGRGRLPLHGFRVPLVGVHQRAHVPLRLPAVTSRHLVLQACERVRRDRRIRRRCGAAPRRELGARSRVVAALSAVPHDGGGGGDWRGGGGVVGVMVPDCAEGLFMSGLSSRVHAAVLQEVEAGLQVEAEFQGVQGVERV